jgi:hypothetical protein
MQKTFWSFDDNVKSSIITEQDNTTKFETLLTFDPSTEILIFILSVSGFTWYLISSLSRLTYLFCNYRWFDIIIKRSKYFLHCKLQRRLWSFKTCLQTHFSENKHIMRKSKYWSYTLIFFKTFTSRSLSFITTLFHSSVHFFPFLVKWLYQTESYSLHDTVGTVPTFNRKIVEICKFDIPSTHKWPILA